MLLRQRNKFLRGAQVDVLQPGGTFTAELSEIYNEDLEPIESAPHAEMTVYWKTDVEAAPGAYLRIQKT